MYPVRIEYDSVDGNGNILEDPVNRIYEQFYLFTVIFHSIKLFAESLFAGPRPGVGMRITKKFNEYISIKYKSVSERSK